MKRTFMSGYVRILVLLITVIAATAAHGSTALGQTFSQTFKYTGEEQTFTVPSGVSEVHIRAVAGQGGSADGVNGGAGASVQAAIPVTSGQTLYLEVGGNGQSEEEGGSGGFNGGGRGGPSPFGAGGGGGASDVRTSPRASGLLPDTRVVVAGAGGGAGGLSHSCGPGARGGAAGQAGFQEGCSNDGGRPGTQTEGGEPGTNGCGPGEAGSLGLGGEGGGLFFDNNNCLNAAGGGGGGGYYGGGGGCGGASDSGGGGGGGSSLVPADGAVELAEGAPEIEITFEAGAGAITEEATEIGPGQATLHGTVVADEAEVTSCSFEYGSAEAFDQQTTCQPEEIGEGTTHVEKTIHGLEPKTVYRYRLKLETSEGPITSNTSQFETTVAPPRITSVSPPAGFTSGGNTVTITGSGFSEATRVRFGEITASYTVESDSQITATAPEGPAGTVDIEVTNPGGDSEPTTADRYTYVTHGHGPAITGLSANKGPAGGGQTITITGTGLVGVTNVSFGETSADYTVTSSTSITAVTPPGATGAVEVTVTTPNGASPATSKDKYTYGAPTITGLSPSRQPITGGPVVVTGTGFKLLSGTVFMFGKVAATNVACERTTYCTMTAPAAQKTSSVEVQATSGGKRSAATPADVFFYEPPTISGLSEHSGPKAGGVELTITGSGFAQGASATTFTFGKTRAIRIDCATATECTLLTPAVTKPGPVDVVATVAKTSSTLTAEDRYTYE